MVSKPPNLNAFEFAVLSGLRVAQLTRGCVPRVLVEGSNKVTVIALREIADGKVVRESAAIVTEALPVAED